MNSRKRGNNFRQNDLFETAETRALLDQLLLDSRLYHQSKDYKKLLDFVVRLRNFAPFNAMLLQVQKPGLSYAASARDWSERFERRPKEGARPLLILWPFGPVALVYDVLDTEGKPLPKDVASFFSHGSINEQQMNTFFPLMDKHNIELCMVDAGDQRAGSIRVIKRATTEKEITLYRMIINRNHSIVLRPTLFEQIIPKINDHKDYPICHFNRTFSRVGMSTIFLFC